MPVSIPASQPNRGSAITGDIARELDVGEPANGVGQRGGARRQRHASLSVGEQVQARTGAFERDAGDGQFAHFEHDGVDRPRAGREAH